MSIKILNHSIDALRDGTGRITAPPWPRRMYRQGDVLLTEIRGSRPSIAVREKPDGGRLILALGEATGHAHAIDARGSAAALFREGDRRYLAVTAPVDLVHEEHGTVRVEPGTYVVRIQREYVPIESDDPTTFGAFAARPVRD